MKIGDVMMRKVKIKELVSFIRGVSYKKEQATKEKQEHRTAILRANNIADGEFIFDELVFVPSDLISKEQVISKGDIVITMSSGSKAHVGKVAIATHDINAAFGAFCAKIVPRTIDPKFLYYILRDAGFRRYIEVASKGTNINNIKQSYILDYEIFTPPLPEQKRIVARIEELFSELDSGVETLKKTKQQLAVYRQAVYASVYTENDMRPITDFFEISSGLTKNSKRNELPIKRPYLRVANVYYNKLDLSEIKSIGVNENEITKTTLKQDDLLFVEGNGSKEQIGRVAIWDGSIEGCLHQNHIIKGRPLGHMLPQYALFYLISVYGRKQILEVAASTSGLYTLSANKVRNLRIPFLDSEKQKQCVSLIKERLSVCDSIEKTVDAALQQAESMRQSILKKAFEGGL